MDVLVLPNMEDEAKKQRAMDEMPQSSHGRTIMTTEPKFIPEDAADLLTDAAIAAPAICFFRIFGDRQKATDASGIMIKIFNRAESAMVLVLCYDKSSDYYME